MYKSITLFHRINSDMANRVTLIFKFILNLYKLIYKIYIIFIYKFNNKKCNTILFFNFLIYNLYNLLIYCVKLFYEKIFLFLVAKLAKLRFSISKKLVKLLTSSTIVGII